MAALLRAAALTLLLVSLVAVGMTNTARAQAGIDDPSGLAPGVPSGSPSAAPTSNRYHLQLTDGSHLIGTLDLGKEIAFESTVGEVLLPVEKIAAVHFTDRPRCRIHFHNGDQLSGSLALMTVKLKTVWGVAEIELQHITAIMSQRHFEQTPQPTPTWIPYATPGAYPATGSYGTGGYSAPAYELPAGLIPVYSDPSGTAPPSAGPPTDLPPSLEPAPESSR
jgi:hypothetical protein